MHSIKLQKEIYQVIDLFHWIGLWQIGDDATVRETRIKLFYSIYYFLCPIFFMACAIISDKSEQFIFSVASAIITTVISVKFLYLIWKKKEIVELLHRICIHSIDDQDEFTLLNNKLKRFMKFAVCFFVLTLFAGVGTVIVSYAGEEKKLFLIIEFPSYWKNNDIAYLIAIAFTFTQVILTTIAVLYSIIKWYLLMNSAFKYGVLGNKLRNMGIHQGIHKKVDAAGNRISEKEKQKLFHRDLRMGIETYSDIIEYSLYSKFY